MSQPRRKNNRFKDRIVIPVDIASKSATFTQKLLKALKGFTVEEVSYDNVTGLAADPTNYFDIEIKDGATSLAKWTTQTGQQGALAADTFVTIPLGVVPSGSAGDVISLVLTLHGTQTLPAGRLNLTLLYA